MVLHEFIFNKMFSHKSVVDCSGLGRGYLKVYVKWMSVKDLLNMLERYELSVK